ncbi:MAG TPA: M28 family peptidase, partial [Pyrinomonadaceae bacterium]|nr:M28 family peptidase [Pyrinomonadaceae bacterium]
AAWKKASGLQSSILGLAGKGAAALVVGNFGTKQQPFSLLSNYLSRRRVSLADTPEPPFKLPPIIIADDAGMEKIFAGTGATYSETLAKAEAGEAVSKDLNKQAQISVRVKKEAGTSSNVVGLLEGADPKLKDQAVVYTAHYDAYGIDSQGRIFPGAADNALGMAEIISIAEAFAKSKTKPKRSVIFLAVTGEEHGLLGAEHWVAHPTWPLEKVAANLNFDGIGTEVYGPVKRVVGFGAEHSDLGPVLEAVVAANGGQIAPDPLPEERVFYRSDHYAFVKKGVPAVMMTGGPEGDVAIWIAKAKKWMETDYHQQTDTIRPDWHWDGARTVAVMGLVMGMRVADAEQMPAWLQTSPFNKPRGGAKPVAPAHGHN